MVEILYGHGSIAIAASLLAAMAVVTAGGQLIGRRGRAAPNVHYREHVQAIQAAVLGLLALLVSFSFSLALQRFDSRSEAVVEESNAIGTALLRAQLLPGPAADEMRGLLVRHLDLRIASADIPLDRDDARRAVVARSGEVLAAAWALAARVAREEPNPVTTGLFVQSLNEAIDAFGRRDAALARHVPEVVWLLLFATFLASGGVVGYTAGLSGHRLSGAAHVLIALVVVLTFVVIDLDRPRRGVIQVDHRPLLQLRESLGAAADVSKRPGRLP